MTQAEALSILKTGANVFLTGEPGSGKTHTISEYISYLRSHGIEPAITASTGIAATHLGGFTIHSWSGIGIKSELDAYELDKIVQNERISKRIERTHVLIIDEVSMLSGGTLSMVEAVCREVKRNGLVFGGMQVILVGDFFQLPPITRDTTQLASKRTQRALGLSEEEIEASGLFAYQSRAWRALNLVVCYLSEQHRQSDDAFVALLSALRMGKAGKEERVLLEERLFEAEGLDEEAHASMTKLFSHNADVDRLNTAALSRIEEDEKEFVMHSSGPAPLVEQLKRGCLSPERLALKVGARVMFTKNNFDGGYVNGTTGEVIGFTDGDEYPIVKTSAGDITASPAEWAIEAEGRILARIIQLPLRLAWAMTVHKSQGMSLDQAVVDLSRAFEYGQGYVALSRVRTLAGLTLLGLNERALEVHPDILTEDQAFREASNNAREGFSALGEEELARMQKQFILACGGVLTAIKIDPTEKKKVPKEKAEAKEDRWRKTLQLIVGGMSVKEAAAARGRTEGTILEHLEELQKIEDLPLEDMQHLLARDVLEDIAEAIAEVGHERLKPIHERLAGEYDFETIRIARLLHR